MAYGEQFKGWCIKCVKYSHKSTNLKCPYNKDKAKNEKNDKKYLEKKEQKNVLKKGFDCGK